MGSFWEYHQYISFESGVFSNFKVRALPAAEPGHCGSKKKKLRQPQPPLHWSKWLLPSTSLKCHIVCFFWNGGNRLAILSLNLVNHLIEVSVFDELNPIFKQSFNHKNPFYHNWGNHCPQQDLLEPGVLHDKPLYHKIEEIIQANFDFFPRWRVGSKLVALPYMTLPSWRWHGISYLGTRVAPVTQASEWQHSIAAFSLICCICSGVLLKGVNLFQGVRGSGQLGGGATGNCAITIGQGSWWHHQLQLWAPPWILPSHHNIDQWCCEGMCNILYILTGSYLHCHVYPATDSMVQQHRHIMFHMLMEVPSNGILVKNNGD